MIRKTCILASTLTLLVAGMALAASVGYKKELVGSIPYGKGQGQILVLPSGTQPGAGPDHLAGDVLGNLFLASSPMRRVEKFDTSGKLVFSLGMDQISQFTALVPDNLGGLWGIYTQRENPDDELFHCDSSGKITARIPTSRLGTARDLWFGFGPLEVSCERYEGVLRVHVGKTSLRIGPDGKVRGKASAPLEDDGGKAFRLQDIDPNLWEIQAINKYGSSLSTKRLKAQAPKGVKGSQIQLSSVPIGMDGAGNFYLIWHIATSHQTKLKNGLSSWSDLVVQKYSSSGKFVSELNLGHSWDYENYPQPFVDRAGRIYMLNYANDGAHLLRWSPGQ